MRSLFLFAIAYLITAFAIAQPVNDVAKAFADIPHKPKLYHFRCSANAPIGGHLQGIQAWTSNDGEHIVLTASSGSYAYYVTGILNGTDATLTKITDAPFRHAGGCQLAGSQLAVGVEDNARKDRAQIMLISTQNGDKHVVATRTGQYKRSTAGATGITQIRNFKVAAVGDWDSRNIDFYKSASTADTLNLFATYHAPEGQSWCSYQSINLLCDTAGHLFLMGFGKCGNSNRADLYSVQFGATSATVDIKLINSRTFNCKKGTGFRYGSGIRVMSADRLAIYTCQRSLGHGNYIAVF